MDEVIEEIEVCPYCMNDRNGKLSCCGEIHFELAYLLDNDEVVLKDDYQR